MNSVPTFLVAAASFLLLVVGMVVVLPRMEDRVDEGRESAAPARAAIGWRPARHAPRSWRRLMASSHRLVPGWHGRRQGALRGVQPDGVPAD